MPAQLYFEDFDSGIEVITDSRTVTMDDVVAFAELSGDHHPLHLDEAYAATTLYGTRIAHGALVLAIATGLAQQVHDLHEVIDAFRQLRWKFQIPVKLGDAIRVHLVYNRKRSLPGYPGGLVIFDVEVLNQDGVVVQQGVWSVLIRGHASSSQA